jgi:hypothetical protein
MYRFAAILGLLLAAAPLSAQGARERIGNFRYHAAADPIDDHDVSEIEVQSEGGGLLPSSLVWRCNGPELYKLYLYRIPLTLEDLVTVTWRVDRGEPHTSAWRVSPNIAWAGDEANDLTDAAEAGSQVAVRVVTRSGATQTSIFRLTGSRRAMARLQCLRVPPEEPAPAAPAPAPAPAPAQPVDPPAPAPEKPSKP